MGADAVVSLHRLTPYPVANGADQSPAPDGVHDTYGSVDELCAHLAEVCASAVDPLEIAAVLEFEGMSEQSVRDRYGFPDVFSLAEEMYRRVPRSPREPLSVADPNPRPVQRALLRGLLYGLPALCYLAAAGLLLHGSALPVLVVSLLVSWAVSHGLAYLGYLRLGWTDAAQARQMLRRGLEVGTGIVVTVMAITALVVHADVGLLAFGIGQGIYMLGACVLMVLGIERLLLVALAPGVLGGATFLVLGRPPTLDYAVWAALAATPALALVLAVRYTRQTGPVRNTSLSVAGEVLGAMPSLAFGFLAAALTAFPIATALQGTSGPNVGATLAAVPLSLSMGAAEWVLHSYRQRIRRVLSTTGQLAGFGRAARLALAGAILLYLAIACLLTTVVVAVAVASGLVRPDQPILAGLLTYLALGVAMFVALLLQAVGARRVPLLACAATLAFVFLFRDWGASAQVVAYTGLFAILATYAAVVLSKTVRHVYAG
jgi:hypothetical protein